MENDFFYEKIQKDNDEEYIKKTIKNILLEIN